MLFNQLAEKASSINPPIENALPVIQRVERMRGIMKDL
jgi:hypothetical protein